MDKVPERELAVNEYVAMWKNFSNFNDRTTREGFWWAFLLNFVVEAVILIGSLTTGFVLVASFYTLASTLPLLAMMIRRLRDAGRAWSWLIVCLIPIIGIFWFLVMMCEPSTEYNGLPEV